MPKLSREVLEEKRGRIEDAAKEWATLFIPGEQWRRLNKAQRLRVTIEAIEEDE